MRKGAESPPPPSIMSVGRKAPGVSSVIIRKRGALQHSTPSVWDIIQLSSPVLLFTFQGHCFQQTPRPDTAVQEGAAGSFQR